REVGFVLALQGTHEQSDGKGRYNIWFHSVFGGNVLAAACGESVNPAGTSRSETPGFSVRFFLHHSLCRQLNQSSARKQGTRRASQRRRVWPVLPPLLLLGSSPGNPNCKVWELLRPSWKLSLSTCSTRSNDIAPLWRLDTG